MSTSPRERGPQKSGSSTYVFAAPAPRDLVRGGTFAPRQGSQTWGRSSLAPLRDSGPSDVAGRGVAADEIVQPGRRRDGAADALALWPDDLRVMGNVHPVSSAADVRKCSRLKESGPGRPVRDHAFRSEHASGALPQILALAAECFGGRVLKAIRGCELPGVSGCHLLQPGIPAKRGGTDLRPLAIMRLEQTSLYAGAKVHDRCRRGRGTSASRGRPRRAGGKKHGCGANRRF